MWLDNASNLDMLFYKPYAKLIKDIVEDKKMNPLTIGIYGNWGAGKSTLLNLIEKEIKDSDGISSVHLNAWMFEGYEDAKIAVMESLLLALKENEKFSEKVKEDITSLLKRVKYIKLGSDLLKTFGPSVVASLVFQNPLPLVTKVSQEAVKKGKEILENPEEITDIKDRYIKEVEKEDIIENIRKFRTEFKEMIKKSQIKNLVVTIDDLDRCSPDRVADTLEAIKLFLSVERTTFIIAVDQDVIKYSVEHKYPKIEGSPLNVSEDYIDKIIQLPIKLSELSDKDVKNYLLLLIYSFYIIEDEFEVLLEEIYKQNMLTREQCLTLIELDTIISQKNISIGNKIKLKKDKEIVSTIADIVASTLKGNPRKTKRFLNTYMTRRKLAHIYFGEGNINDKILAKLLVLENISEPLYKKMYGMYKLEGKKLINLKNIADKIETDQELTDEENLWNTFKLKAWLKIEPTDIYDMNLDNYFYLSREMITNIDGDLSSQLEEDEKELFEQFISQKEVELNKIVKQINEKTKDSKYRIIRAIIMEFENGKIEMRRITNIFISTPEFREDICNAITNRRKEIEMLDSVQLKRMYKEDSLLLDSKISIWKEKGILKDDEITIIKK